MISTSVSNSSAEATSSSRFPPPPGMPGTTTRVAGAAETGSQSTPRPSFMIARAAAVTRPELVRTWIAKASAEGARSRTLIERLWPGLRVNTPPVSSNTGPSPV